MVLSELLDVLFYDDIDTILNEYINNYERHYPHDIETLTRKNNEFLQKMIPDKAEFINRIDSYAKNGEPVWHKQVVQSTDIIAKFDIASAFSNGTCESAKKRIDKINDMRNKWAIHADEYGQLVAESGDGLILELATGAGMGTCIVAQAMSERSRLVSVDIDYCCTRNADGIAAALDMTDRLCGMTANFWYLPFEDETFDTACTHYGLDESGEIGKTLSEISRVLKPDGKFVCVSRENPYDRHKVIMQPFGISENECNLLLNKARLYSGVADLIKTAEQNGLRLIINKRIKPENSHARIITVFEKNCCY